MNVKGTIFGEREGTPLAVWKGDGIVLQSTFSPSGDRIVSAEGNSLRVRDSQTGAVVAGSFEGHTGCVRSVAFSPDGARIVSGSGDCTIRVWDSQTSFTVAGPFGGHTDWVRSVAFSSDGTRIVSASDDPTIRVSDSQTIFGRFGGTEPDYSEPAAPTPSYTQVEPPVFTFGGRWVFDKDGWATDPFLGSA